MPTAVHVARDFAADACCHGKCLCNLNTEVACVGRTPGKARHRCELLIFDRKLPALKIFKRSKKAQKKRFIIILEKAEAFNLLLDFSGKTLEPET